MTLKPVVQVTKISILYFLILGILLLVQIVYHPALKLYNYIFVQDIQTFKTWYPNLYPLVFLAREIIYPAFSCLFIILTFKILQIKISNIVLFIFTYMYFKLTISYFQVNFFVLNLLMSLFIFIVVLSYFSNILFTNAKPYILESQYKFKLIVNKLL